MPYFGTKNALFGYFWPRMPYLSIFRQEFWKHYCQIWNQHPWICLISKYREIIKMLKLRTKSALFGYFQARILKIFCHIWNQHIRISGTANFCEETKMSYFGTKNALFGYFWPRIPYLGLFGREFLKNYCHIWNQHPQICLIANFMKEQKCLILGPKMPDIGNLGLDWKQYCHVWNQDPRICLTTNVRGKIKMPKFETKTTYLGIFYQKYLIWVFWG